MLTAVPKSWASSSYHVLDGGVRVATIELSWHREAGSIEVEGRRYLVGRTGWWSGTFYLEDDGEHVLTAEKPSVFRRSFDVALGPARCRLEAPSVVSRRMELWEDGRCTGEIRPTSIFSRKAIIDLPEEMPLVARMFLTWLVLILWRRQRQSSS